MTFFFTFTDFLSIAGVGSLLLTAAFVLNCLTRPLDQPETLDEPEVLMARARIAIERESVAA